MKKLSLAIAAVVSLGALSNNAFAEDYSKLKKQLNILNSVFTTSLKQNTARETIKFQSLDVRFLAGQGIVYEINTSRSLPGMSRGFKYNFNFGQLMPKEPVAPVVAVGGTGQDIVYVDTDEITVAAEQATALAEQALIQATEQFEDGRDRLRDLADEERELNWRRREIGREKRDLEFRKRHAEKESLKEIEEEVSRLNKRDDALKQKVAELKKYALELKKENETRLQEQAEARKKSYISFLSQFEHTVANTMCDYGAGVKSIKDGQYVTFILNDFDIDAVSGKATTFQWGNSNIKDTIYVFDTKDISQCITEKINSDELLSKAKKYTF